MRNIIWRCSEHMVAHLIIGPEEPIFVNEFGKVETGYVVMMLRFAHISNSTIDTISQEDMVAGRRRFF